MVRVTVNRGTSTARVGSARGKKTRRKPSMRSGRGTVSRGGKKSKSRPTGMRAARASGKVKRSGRGYIAASGKTTKRKAAKPSMRSGRGTISRSSAGSYKKTARRKASTRSGRGYIRR